MNFLHKILGILNIVLLSSSIFMVHNFYSAQNQLGNFLQTQNIYFRHNIKSTFIIIDHKQHTQVFKNLLKYNINVIWYKIDKNRTLAVINPSASTIELLIMPMNTFNNKCHLIISSK